ncbi:hypothetical protein [Phaeobacter inhibens]|nr:hypothetical protein [Phaeobacter inhibens]WHP68768.1 hypothetical protein QMZ01_00840 [Phaeobacter inhibens]
MPRIDVIKSLDFLPLEQISTFFALRVNQLRPPGFESGVSWINGLCGQTA